MEDFQRLREVQRGYDSVKVLLRYPAPGFKFPEGNPFPLKNLPGRRAIQGEAEPRETVRYVNKQTGEAAWNILKSTAIFDHEHWREPFQGLVSDYIFPAKSSNATVGKFGLKVKGGTVLRSVLPFLFTICMDFRLKLDDPLPYTPNLLDDQRSQAKVDNHHQEKHCIAKIVGEAAKGLQDYCANGDANHLR